MATEQDESLQEPVNKTDDNINNFGKQGHDSQEDFKADFLKNNHPEDFTNQQLTDEVTNNDGSIVETLDTALHNNPGYITDHSLAGSNRADYYEARSQGKSDTDEEIDYLRNQQP